MKKFSVFFLIGSLAVSGCVTNPLIPSDSNANGKNQSSDDSTKTGLIAGLGTGAASMLYCTSVLRKGTGECLIISAALGAAMGYAAKKIDESMANSVQRLDCKGAMDRLNVTSKIPTRYRIDLTTNPTSSTIVKSGEKIVLKPFYSVVSTEEVKLKTAIVVNNQELTGANITTRACGGYSVPDFEIDQKLMRPGKNEIKFELLDASNPKRTVLATSSAFITSK